ncbi:ABC transporter substrate-binding protein [Bradyrhizobium roseum]|uniref:ABC transporter substrate-binding protein n=1 Tax=Bradyrhizobium roseum TaxID=3056648 RepID=UPI00263068B9|nr:ABC transporter substrate-binding protein [Bradyrhizobium roseus]WKA28081.1 ABC transporter substrate-binding protein [Bradyrhizobium roseus]
MRRAGISVNFKLESFVVRILVNLRWTSLLVSSLFITAAQAAPGDKIELVRDLAGRVGPVIGSALACPDVTRPRVQAVIEKFAAVIRDAASNEAQRADLAQQFDRSVADGRNAVSTGRMDCIQAERRLADLEQSLAPPASPPAAAVAIPSLAPPAFAAAPTTTLPTATGLGNPVTAVRGVSDNEIRFGITAAFTGPVRERGRQMKLGIETAFNQVNDAGGIAGRKLRIIAADDGNEPARTLLAVRQLYEKDQIFGLIGSIGTATAAVAVPFALERRMLFFGAYTGGNVVRRDPPDRYVFNYRPSYAEEADAAVRYLVKLRKIPIRQIAVFAQTDDLGDAGFSGVAKAYRAMGLNDSAILRLNYPRNTIEVDEAVNTLRVQKVPVRAIIMSASYRAAAKFIEKTRALYPEMIFTSISGVGGSSLADELKLLGPRYTTGVLVTQVVPAVSGYSSAVLEYKNALAKHFPGEAPDYASLEGFIAANILIDALKRVGPQLDTEKLVDTLEATRNLDLGLGVALNFGRSEHTASKKIWGTALDESGRFQAVDLE